VGHALKLALYKGKGNWTDKAIRKWTKSEYSHCELVIDNIWYSSSPRDGCVRAKQIEPQEGNWDYIEITCNPEQQSVVLDTFRANMGSGYDYTGILFSQVLPIGIQMSFRWFCSEICSQALMNASLMTRDKRAQWYNPERLRKAL